MAELKLDYVLEQPGDLMIPKRENSLVRSISREVDFAWLAGIVDGEANIQATIKKANNGKCYFMPKLRIANTDVKMIRKISEIYESLNVCWFYNLRKRKHDTWKPLLYIEVASQGSVKKVLNAISKYMVNKKEPAEVLVDLIGWVQSQPKGGNTVSYDYTEDPLFKNLMDVFKEKYTFRFDPSETTRRARKVLAW